MGLCDCVVTDGGEGVGEVQGVARALLGAHGCEQHPLQAHAWLGISPTAS